MQLRWLVPHQSRLGEARLQFRESDADEWQNVPLVIETPKTGEMTPVNYLGVPKIGALPPSPTCARCGRKFGLDPRSEVCGEPECPRHFYAAWTNCYESLRRL